jgi:hypothetical protein
MDIDRDEIHRRFTYYPPSPERADATRSGYVRNSIGSAASELADLLPEGREKSLAITALEEAMFWSNAAIARQGT